MVYYSGNLIVLREVIPLIILVLLASLIPSVLLFFFLRSNRKEDPEYKKECSKSLLRGVLCAAILVPINLVLQLLWRLTGIGKAYPLLDQLFSAFILAATVEEMLKFLMAKKSFTKQPEKTSRLDVIAFTTICAIGFGLIEDVVYVFETNIGQILVRGLLMGHAAYGLFIGLLYSKGMAKDSTLLKVLAVLIPTFLHGLYDFSLNEGLPDVFAFIAVLDTLFWTVFLIVMIFFVKKKRKDPVYTCPILSSEQVFSFPKSEQ